MARSVFGFIAVLTLSVTAAAAQTQQPPPTGADVRVAVGIGQQGGVFGDDDPESSLGVGLSLAVQVRGQTARRTGASLEVAFHPIGIRNPHFDETLRTVFLLAGAEIGRTFYVRPAFGIGLQLWSGTRAESGGGFALGAGIAVGRKRVGSARTGLEVMARCAGSPGAIGWMIGVQVPIGLRRSQS